MQVLKNTPYSALQSALQGFRLMISEPGSGSNKTGFRYMGTVFAPKFEPNIEYYEHHETASGGDVIDRKIPKLAGFKISFTCDDLFSKNYERFMFGRDQVKVAADAAATHAAETFVAGATDDLHGLDEGRQTDAQKNALAVYNVTDGALLVENTDYKKTRIHSWTFIEMMVDTHAGDVIRIGTGATASTDYTFNKLAHFEVAPMTRYEREVRAVIQAPSKTGGGWEWKVEKAALTPDGEYDVNVEQAASMKLALDIKDNSAAEPSYPFGKLRQVGYDDAGGSLL